MSKNPSKSPQVRKQDLKIRAAFTSGTINTEERTVEVTFATTTPVRRYDWRAGTAFLEELSFDPSDVNMERLENGAPVIDNHNSWGGARGQLGVVESASLNGDNGTATLRFAKTDDVDPIWQKIEQGIIRGISVGYVVKKYEKVPMTEDETIPRYIAREWEPYEISLAPIPADVKSGIRSKDQKEEDFIEVELTGERSEGVTGEKEENQTPGLELAKRQIQINKNKG